MAIAKIPMERTYCVVEHGPSGVTVACAQSPEKAVEAVKAVEGATVHRVSATVEPVTVHVVERPTARGGLRW